MKYYRFEIVSGQPEDTAYRPEDTHIDHITTITVQRYVYPQSITKRLLALSESMGASLKFCFEIVIGTDLHDRAGDAHITTITVQLNVYPRDKTA